MKALRIGRYVVPLWLVAVILISGICSGALGYYIWKTLNIPFEVKEPIEILSYPSQLSLYAGESLVFNITVENHASVNYSVTLDLNLSNTTYQTQYVTFSNEVYVVLPGQQNLRAWLTVEPDAPPINASLIMSFERTGEFSFLDDFNSLTLNNKWTIVDPIGDSIFNLTSVPGCLTISTTSPPNRDLNYMNFYSPRIIQPIYGNFTAETKLQAIFNMDVRHAGIFIWKDHNNYFRLDRAFRLNTQEITYIGTISGTWSMPAPDTSNPGAVLHVSNINPTYLRLVRRGMTYSGYYSVDGLNWNFLADITMDIGDSIRIGLFAEIQAPTTAFAVSFDYFKVSSHE